MDTTMKKLTPTLRWLQWLLRPRWYEWLGGIVEASLLFVFAAVTYTQFAEDEPRAGWIMILLTILFAGPGIWLVFGYRPKEQSGFGKFDVGLIICFAIWGVLLSFLLGWKVHFYPGPFGA